MSKAQRNINLVRAAVKGSTEPMSVLDIMGATQLSEWQVREAIYGAQRQGRLHVVARARARGASFVNFYATYAVERVEFLTFTPRVKKTTSEILNRAKELGGHFGVLVAQLEG